VEQAFLVQISRSFWKIDSFQFKPAIEPRLVEAVIPGSQGKGISTQTFDDRLGSDFWFRSVAVSLVLS
jgi:hypothetical protein